MGRESINTEIVTLSRHLSEEQAKHKEATGDFTYVDWEMLKFVRPQLTLHPRQSAMPRAPILFQVDSLLHPTSLADQPVRPRWLFQHHR